MGLVETFLTTRCPGKRLEVMNAGWSGDTARGGNARWARDAAPAAPTLVFADFGMNDGAYGGFDPWILDAWLPPLKGILDQARAGGARCVLLTPSVTDPHDAASAWLKGYDDTLASMVAAEVAFGAREDVPVIDLFTPMRAALARARAAQRPTFVPDGIHPDEAGGLLMAWSILRALDLPRGLGDLVLTPAAATGPVRAAKPDATPTGLHVDLALPYLPFWAPPDARRALAACSFADDLNRFRLVVRGWPAAPAATTWLLIDGRAVARLSAADLEAGVDLAALDAAPWARAGRAIHALATRRNAMRFEAWRTVRLRGREWGGLAVPGADPGTPAATAAEREADAGRVLDAAAAAAAAAMHALAQPQPWRLDLVTVAPWSRRAALPRGIEDFEDGTLEEVNGWDESVTVSSTTLFATSGRRALRLDFDAARDAAPSASIGMPCPLDLTETPRIAVDVTVLPGSLPAGTTVAFSLSLGPEERGGKRKKDQALKPFEVKGSRALADGGHGVVTFDLAGAPAAVAGRVSTLSLALTLSPTGGRGGVVFDALRAVP